MRPLYHPDLSCDIAPGYCRTWRLAECDHPGLYAPIHKFVEAKVKDFQRIVDWIVDDHSAEHRVDLEWLKAEIAGIRREEDGQRRRIIVVTHRAPTIRGPSRFEHLSIAWTSAFFTDLLKVDGHLEPKDVQWWMFGHTLFNSHFSRGRLKLISNQRGYVLPNTTE